MSGQSRWERLASSAGLGRLDRDDYAPVGKGVRAAASAKTGWTGGGGGDPPRPTTPTAASFVATAVPRRHRLLMQCHRPLL